MTTDAAINNDLELAKLTTETKEKLETGLPEAASIKNPIDIIADASPERYEFTLDTLLKDPNVDGIIYIVTPQSVTNLTGCANVLIKYVKSGKPVLASFSGGTRCQEAEKILEEKGIPNYPSPRKVVKTMKSLNDYNIIKNQEYPKPPVFDTDKETVKKIIENANKRNVHTLGLESFELLKAYQIPTADTIITRTIDETVQSADMLGYPLVMKIVSPQISHKTDVGGIRLNLKNKEEIQTAYKDMMQKVRLKEPDANIDGVQLQRMLSDGVEVIIGMVRDPTFGPMIMFGLGGVYVELFKDVVFKIAPVSRIEAENMMKEIKAFKLLLGARGDKPKDIESITDTILKVSQLVTDFPQINEFEINPLIVSEEGSSAVDMRLNLKKK